MSIYSFGSAFSPAGFATGSGPLDVPFSSTISQTQVIAPIALTAVKSMSFTVAEYETLSVYMRKSSPIYTPQISPNVDIIFKGNGTYIPQISPNVDIVFGTGVAPTSGGGGVSSNSQFFLVFF